jgi:hypothetical protein
MTPGKFGNLATSGPHSWEFAPRAASAMLQRSIDYRRTDADLLQDAGIPAGQGDADPMMRTMMKSKIHRATVTQADLHYVGSVTIDAALLDAADLLEGEKVAIVDVTNGARLET